MIDVHAHAWPHGLLRAVAAGAAWWGYEPVELSDGRRVLALGDRLIRFAPPRTDLADISSRLRRRRDEYGIEAELVQPVGFLWGEHLHGADLEAYLDEVNVELADAQRQQPERFVGVGLLPLHDARVVPTALDRILGSGLEVVTIPTNARGRNLDDPTVLPLIEDVLARGIPVIIHPTYLTPIGSDRLPRYYFANSFGAPMEAAVALLSLVQSGLLDRYPDARLLVANGAGCAPAEIGRFDRRWDEREDARSMLEPPSHYLPRVFYDSLVLDEETLRLLVTRVGSDRVAVGTDFPFRSDRPEGPSAWLDGMDWLDDDAEADLRWRTAERFLGRRLLSAAPRERA
jgi:aminocarboxymuconate-semialdehyde decarboxylase